jgi:hypothetical protein
MGDATGKEFERLTQRVFAALHRQENVRNVRVEHDVSLTGVTGVKHQVDVYWEFVAAGIDHRVVVECKDLGRPVDLGVVNTLLGVLSDLPGQPRGVIVAKSGFQSGATELAQSRGITLYELREPEDADWDGFIARVQINGVVYLPHLAETRFLLHESDADAPGVVGLKISGLTGKINFEREDGSVLTTVGDVLQDHLFKDAPKEPEDVQWREYDFSEPTFVRVEHPSLARVRVRGFAAQVQLRVGAMTRMEVRFDELVALILKDVTKGDWVPLNAQGEPLGQQLARTVKSDDPEDK